MSAHAGLVGKARLEGGARSSGRHHDHWFFSGMALAAALIVFLGFARSYYLRGVFGAPPLSTLLHVHGILFTAWVLLFVTQTSLIAARRVSLHRKLGAVGAMLGTIMLLVGYVVAVESARLGRTPPGGPPPLVFLAIPLGAIATFAVLMGAGLHQRLRSETHKRLMLLATIALLPPAVARMPLVGGGGPPVAMGTTTLLVLGCLLYDRAAHGRIHRAFLWGGLFLLFSMPLRVVLGHTDGWLSFAGWLTR